MARIHGRFGRVYMALTSSGSAEPVAFLNSWSLNFTVDKADVTAFGDPNKIYVAGLPDAAGEFSGWYDDATVQTYTAATDGIKRKFYLYPSTNSAGQYWHGEIFPDFQASSGVGDAVQIQASWNAASPVIKVG
jgi:hypothetical protein